MKNTAFVAMKFAPGKSAETDATYSRIREVLAEAGYDASRADEIRTSGPVVDEVCEQFRASDLVVIDSTGDSHSVSYEIGFCHGIGRSPNSTILLRRGKCDDIPFNFRHFRHRCYGTLAQLEGELRKFLGISAPLPERTICKVLTYDIAPDVQLDYAAIAECLRSMAQRFQLSGRLETYYDDGFLQVEVQDWFVRARTSPVPSDQPRFFRFVIAYKPRSGRWNDEEALEDMPNYFAAEFKRLVTPVAPEPALSEAGPVGPARETMRRFVTWQLERGKITHILYEAEAAVETSP